MKIRKNLEKGSATMIVIFVIFFIVIILSTFLVYVTSKRNNQLKETEKLSEIYNGDIQEIYEERKNREKYSFFNKISPNICNEIIFYNNCIQYDFTVFFINFKLKENNNGKTISIKSACS